MKKITNLSQILDLLPNLYLERDFPDTQEYMEEDWYEEEIVLGFGGQTLIPFSRVCEIDLDYHLALDKLKQTYHDPDFILFYSAFQCLCNYVEKEDGLEYAELNNLPYKELYDWWISVREDEDFDYLSDESKEKFNLLMENRNSLWT